jgi:NTP pyrophosphatase (non-canonical NTP hydrolase)
MDQLYGSRDRQRGVAKTLMWFFSEIGELADAIRNDNRISVEEEMADIFAWLCSLANLYDIDLEEALTKKYPNKCPKCLKSPCDCPFQ